MGQLDGNGSSNRRGFRKRELPESRKEVAATEDRVESAGDVARGQIMRGLVGSTKDMALDSKRNEKA